MKDVPVSGYGKTGDLVYFARMCSKIHLHRRGLLHSDYHPFLGTGFDGRCCRFLHVTYEEVCQRVEEGFTDLEILEWCYQHGRKPGEEEIFIWNLFMEKRGWRDDDSAMIRKVKEDAGWAERDEIQTLFDLFDFEEGRRS